MDATLNTNSLIGTPKLYVQEAPPEASTPRRLRSGARQAKCYLRPVGEDRENTTKAVSTSKHFRLRPPTVMMELCIAFSVALFIIVASWILSPSIAANLSSQLAAPTSPPISTPATSMHLILRVPH
jgi:hypothetical protein